MSEADKTFQEQEDKIDSWKREATRYRNQWAKTENELMIANIELAAARNTITKLQQKLDWLTKFDLVLTAFAIVQNIAFIWWVLSVN